VWTYVIPHPTRVPNVEGDRLAAAQREAERAALELVVAREAFSSEVPAGRVISQSLEAGSEAEEGDTLTVVLSRGPELVPVPSVEGVPLEEARRRIRRARFEVEVRRQYHETISEGEVISQSPGAETPLEVGESVEVVVSQGQEPVEVPRVIGLSEDAAASSLRSAGLGVRVTEGFSATVPEGDVVSQSPEAFETVAADSIVTINVSKGPREFPMPNVIGKTETQATSQLERLGLVVEKTQLPSNPGNTVVGQEPDSGVTVRQGQTVTLYLAAV
jgi:eukaryotic-like serine/threonine-protein kinase